MSIIEQLSESLCCLPGVGPKTAQRLVYHFLKNNRKQALILAQHLEQAMKQVVQCQNCNNFCTQALCEICQNPNRNPKLLCIVEQAFDVYAFEQSRSYQGNYFILTAKISPIDGIGVEDLGLDKLEQYLKQQPLLEEVILALSPSIESQATIHYLQQSLSHYPKLKISQLAQGIPSGSEIQSLDPLTLSAALKHRSIID
jgi:recombination protein RecR